MPCASKTIAQHAATFPSTTGPKLPTRPRTACSKSNPANASSAHAQHAHQLLQRTRIEPAPHFDSPPAAQLHHQRVARRADACRRPPAYLHCQQCTAASWRLPLPSPVPAKGAQRQPPLPAEFDPAQSTRFVLRNQLLDLKPAPPALPYTHLFFIHAPTSSPD